MSRWLVTEWWDEAVAVANKAAEQSGRRFRVRRWRAGWVVEETGPRLEVVR